MSKLAAGFRLFLGSPLLVVGSMLLLLGTGPLVVCGMLDPSANPVLLGMLAGCSFPIAALITVGGLADLGLRVIPEHCRQAEQQRRKQQGLCLQCGYDLRGSRERCPECGTAFVQPEGSGIRAEKSPLDRI